MATSFDNMPRQNLFKKQKRKKKKRRRYRKKFIYKTEKENLQEKDIGIWRRGAKEGGQKTGIDQDDDLKNHKRTYL